MVVVPVDLLHAVADSALTAWSAMPPGTRPRAAEATDAWASLLPRPVVTRTSSADAVSSGLDGSVTSELCVLDGLVVLMLPVVMILVPFRLMAVALPVSVAT